MHICICNNNPCPGCIFNGETRLPIHACNTTDCSREVVSVEALDVVHCERVNVEVVKAEKLCVCVRIRVGI